MGATDHPVPAPALVARLRAGLVIPAHPLALTPSRRFDEKRQRALTRYYLAAGAGGLAVGVHTTQFAIRDPRHGLFRPVLELAAETAGAGRPGGAGRPVLVAGICGRTRQAVAEAETARELGYDTGLLALGAWPEAGLRDLLNHARTVAREIPLFGFYLQPAVGGRVLPYRFWREFAESPNLVAIKIAPFNRYQTLEVVRAVVDAGRAGEVALYTGNDDHILLDLVSEVAVVTGGREVRVRMVGGLLGHWACGTRRAVEQFARCRRARVRSSVPASLITLANQVTEANAAFFDAAHGFRGCIAGIHEVLFRQGLLRSRACLDPAEKLSRGQADEISRVLEAYPHLDDTAFVREHLEEWLA